MGGSQSKATENYQSRQYDHRQAQPYQGAVRRTEYLTSNQGTPAFTSSSYAQGSTSYVPPLSYRQTENVDYNGVNRGFSTARGDYAAARNGGYATYRGQSDGRQISSPYKDNTPIGEGYTTMNTSRSIIEGRVTHDPSRGVNIQSTDDFNEEVNALLYTQPLIIHTQILPPGVSANDPRLQHAKVISERTYTTDKPVFPQPTFTATIHPSLISPNEPERRLVLSG